MKKLAFVLVAVALVLFSGCTAFNRYSGKTLRVLWRVYNVGPYSIELPDQFVVDHR